MEKKNQCFSKVRKQVEDAENNDQDEQFLPQKMQKTEYASSPYQDSLSNKSVNDRVLSDKVDDLKDECLSHGNSIKNVRQSQHVTLDSNRSVVPSSTVRVGFVYYSKRAVDKNSEEGSRSETATLFDNVKDKHMSNHPSTKSNGKLGMPDRHDKPPCLRRLTCPVSAPIPTTLSTFSSSGPSIPSSLNSSNKHEESELTEKKSHRMSFAELGWGKFLGLSSTPETCNAENQEMKRTPMSCKERFVRLQAFLKQCDECDQQNYFQALRSLSPAARSRHAFELEKRAITLSLQEGKELHRMKVLNIRGGKISGNKIDVGATPQGLRLPTPGTAAYLKCPQSSND